MRFLVIGGHAVIEHGFRRGTEDADILISRNDRDAWTKIVTDLGYKMIRDGGAFMQFESPEPAQWDPDLMLVPAVTFGRLLATAKPATLEDAAVVVPSLAHLLALKIHALKHGRGLRTLKDMTDVAQLLSVNRIDPNSAWCGNCLKNTVTWNCMNESSDYSLRESRSIYGNTGELEFPDWSGHLPHRSRVSNDAWLAYCRSNLAKIRASPGYAEGRGQDGINTEFRL